MSTQTNLVTVLKCGQVWEAEIVRERLEAAGLKAFVQGGETATSLSYVGVALGGVRVQVPADQEEQARALLEEDERQQATAGPWKCPRCNEPNGAGFDFCYSCSMPRGDAPADYWDEDADESDVDSEDERKPVKDTAFLRPKEEVSEFGNEDGNPYRFVGQTVERHEIEPDVTYLKKNERNASQLVSRAYRWAIIGLFFPIPVFHIVSLGLLTQAGSEGAWRVKELRRKVIGLIIFDLLVLVTVSFILYATLFP